MTKLLDGKKIANEIKEGIAKEVRAILEREERPPHLAAILVGEEGASQTYVAAKEKDCHEVGFTSSVYRLPEQVKERELLDVVRFLNEDPEIDGFIVQLPLPAHIKVSRIVDAIDPAKDVDGFHPANLGRMLLNEPAYLPATPFGIMQLIEKADIDISGKHCVVLGRSNIVGTPLSLLLSRKAKPGNATVTLCHSFTQNLEEITRTADVIIAAIGVPKFLKANMVKKGAVVIDVGIHRVPDTSRTSGYALLGDVDFEEVAPLTSLITPVPGGVGPMTRVGLLINTLRAYRKEVYPNPHTS